MICVNLEWDASKADFETAMTPAGWGASCFFHEEGIKIAGNDITSNFWVLITNRDRRLPRVAARSGLS